MMKYVLLRDDSSDSQKAIKELDNANITYDKVSFPTDGDLQPPVLFMPEGRCEGYYCISSFVHAIKLK